MVGKRMVYMGKKGTWQKPAKTIPKLVVSVVVLLICVAFVVGFYQNLIPEMWKGILIFGIIVAVIVFVFYLLVGERLLMPTDLKVEK